MNSVPVGKQLLQGEKLLEVWIYKDSSTVGEQFCWLIKALKRPRFENEKQKALEKRGIDISMRKATEHMATKEYVHRRNSWKIFSMKRITHPMAISLFLLSFQVLVQRRK